MIIGRVRKMISVTTITAAYNDLSGALRQLPYFRGASAVSLDKSRQRGQDVFVETSYHGVSDLSGALRQLPYFRGASAVSLDKSRQRGHDDSVETSYHGALRNSTLSWLPCCRGAGSRRETERSFGRGAGNRRLSERL